MKNRGFTLIELIVVIAIIAVLAAIIAPNAFKAIEKAKISATVEDLQAIKTASMSYYSDVGQWVATCSAATVPTCPASAFIINTAAGIAGWDGPYLEKWPSASKWAGVYNFNNASGQVFCTGATCSAQGERYTSITNIPATAAPKVDTQLDGAIGNATGSVRYAVVYPTTLNVMVSRDGPTD